MTRIYNLVVLLVLSTVCVFSQTVEGPISTLDYRFLSPASQALHNGRLFTSYYDRGGILEFHDSLKRAVWVSGFERIRASQLFHCGDELVASTVDGSIRRYNDSSSRWELIGTYSCQPFVVDDVMYVLSNDSVLLLRRAGSMWTDSVVGSISTGYDDVNSLIVVGERIVYSKRNSTTIFIALLSGALQRMVQSPYPVDGLSILADGSIAITSFYRTSKVLRADSIDAGTVSNLEYKSSILSLANASWFHSSSMRGLVGSFSVYGSDPREGVYVVFTPDSIVKRADLDTMVEKVVLVTIQDGNTILSSYRQLCIVDGNGMSTRARWFQDTSLGISSGVSFTTSGTPFLCGDATIDGSTFPVLYPVSDSSDIRVLPISDKSGGLLIRYVRLHGGPEVAFCSFGIFTKSGSDSWKKVVTTKADLQSRHIDVVNDSTIVCRSPANLILVSTDKGSTWRSITIKDYLWDMTPVISSGTSMYAHSQGDVWALDLNNSSDSVAPPHVRISPGSDQRLYACSPYDVQIVSARSDVDPSYRPKFYTHVVCHQWTPAIPRLDSTSHRLDTPMESSGLVIIVRKDTAYFWNSVHRRLLAVTYNGIISDTTIQPGVFAPFSDQPISSVVYDNAGTPWLFASGLVTGFRLDPSSPVVTSINDYYDYMYVGAIHPNPAEDNVTVTLGRFPAAVENNVQLYLVDMQGSVVRNFTDKVMRFSGPLSTQTVQINVDGLPWGMYLVVIENSQGKSVGKLIVTP
jgi:hypothetical protein